MPIQDAHDSAPSATAVDAALITTQQCARAAALAADHLADAERSTKPVHARRWRIAAFSALQETQVLVRRAMLQLAAAGDADADARGVQVELTLAVQQLEALADREATLTGGDAIRRAAAELIARNGGVR
jgi:hypothetical protein